MPTIVDDEPMGGGDLLSIFESGAILDPLRRGASYRQALSVAREQGGRLLEFASRHEPRPVVARSGRSSGGA